MTDKKYFLAFDLGASSGRAILGTFADKKLKLTEVHRFRNQMMHMHGSFYWNIYSLFEELKTGLAKCIIQHRIQPESIGIDTWGVDYALVNAEGQLAALPYAYRDSRTNNIMDQFFKVMPKNEAYLLSGIQFMQFNTLFQLFASVQKNYTGLQVAQKLLFIPDVLNYLFTGEMKNEYTIASTSQLLKPGKPEWEPALLRAAGINPDMMGEIVQPGTTIGKLLPDVARETGCREIPCIAVASHDTASAVVSVPAEGENWAYLSSGTWSLLGIESQEPLVSEKTMQLNFTNEGGIDGTTRFLKNIMGMWLIQECKRIWDAEKEISWLEIVELSEVATPFKCLINPDDSSFLNPDDMPGAVRQFCRDTNQPVPETRGEIARCIYESLALKYRHSIEQIESVTGKKIEKLHIIGGGANNKMLNRFTAAATGIPVLAGPAEATATGNILMQARAAGLVDSLDDMRQIVRNSSELEQFNPQPGNEWDKAYSRFVQLF